MSWDAYVDTSRVGSGTLDKAAIFSADGTSVWAASKDFKISADEAKTVAGLYKDTDKAWANGLHLDGVKYVTLKADTRSLYGKKGKTGIICVKTDKALLIGHYDEEKSENQIAGKAAVTVEGLADYLGGLGF